MTVLVLFGGRSGEHEVSLMSARSVRDALHPDQFKLVDVGIDHSGRWWGGTQVLESFERGELDSLEPVFLRAEPGDRNLYRWSEGGPPEPIATIDVVFPVLHGTFGEDGTLQGLLEMAALPYVGCGVLASSVAMDKGLFKQVMKAEGLPVLDYVVINASDIREHPETVLDVAETVGDYPLFTKPANLGSSVGVTKCAVRSDLIEGLMEAARYDRRVIVEAGIQAREIEVSVLGNEVPRASVPGEVVPSDEFYSYRAKYIDDASELHIPAPVDGATRERIRELAVRAYRAIDGAGMARADFLMDKVSGEVFVNELNTIPGFTKISMYPKLWEASDLPYPELCDRLIELAFERQAAKDGLQRAYGESK